MCIGQEESAAVEEKLPPLARTVVELLEKQVVFTIADGVEIRMIAPSEKPGLWWVALTTSHHSFLDETTEEACLLEALDRFLPQLVAAVEEARKRHKQLRKDERTEPC